MSQRLTSRVMRIALSLLVVAAACTRSPEPDESNHPSAAEAAEAFALSMSEGDYGAVVEEMRDVSGRQWTSIEFERWLQRRLDAGLVTAVAFDVDGEVQEPEAEEFENGGSPSVRVPYSITYVSEAAEDPVALSGDLDLTFDSEAEEWIVEWS